VFDDSIGLGDIRESDSSSSDESTLHY
jgi:hypothetical protein